MQRQSTPKDVFVVHTKSPLLDSAIVDALAKLLVGTVSGELLAKYCPEVGAKHSATMWLIVALMATVAPVGLIALRRHIRVHEAGRDK